MQETNYLRILWIRITDFGTSLHGAKVVERNKHMRENVQMWYIKILWGGALRNTRSSEGNQRISAPVLYPPFTQ
jgi:hypothetical protein